MKTAIRFAIGFVLVSASFARDFRPDGRLENIPASDTSVQQCYIFRTVPGVLYRVESCNDLSSWTAGDEIYGMCHEFVTAMREYTPPPPAPPGTPPATPPVPAIHASLRIRPSSGAAGGTVVSWKSLDHGGPVVMLHSQAMTSNWNRVPLYWDRFGNHDFFIGCDGPAIPPPAENPALGAKDAAMFAELEASFPAINLAVDESAARARNTPPPAPADPNSRKFWRVHCDWGLDTDEDGSPDWMEFDMEGSAADGLRGGAFLADTNGNGIPDGDELDYDQDGVADAKDADKEDVSAAYQIGPVPRYALFPITNAQPPQWDSAPWQINDRGTVLYSNGTWCGGQWKPLTLAVDLLKNCAAKSINDSDVILGTGALEFAPETGTHTQLRVCYWPEPAGTPSMLSVEAMVAGQNKTVFPSPNNDFASGLLRFGPVISNDGTFIQNTHHAVGVDYPYLRPSEWKIPEENDPATETSAQDGLRYDQGPDLKWGLKISPNGTNGLPDWSLPLKGQVYAPGLLPDLSFSPLNVVRLPQDRIIAMPYMEEEAKTAQAFYNGTWHAGTIYSQAIDVSADGTAIGKCHDGKNAPILLNGQWMDVSDCAPDLPQNWKQSLTTHLDTTAGGWILTSDNYPAISGTNYAAMLPIKMTPPEADRLHWDGLDGISTGALEVPVPVEESHWIMVPLGGNESDCVLKAPLNSNTPLKLSGGHLRFNGAQETSLTAAENTFAVSAESGYAPASGTEGKCCCTSAPWHPPVPR